MNKIKVLLHEVITMDIDELLLIIEKNKLELSKIEEDFYDRIRKRIEELEEIRKTADESEILRCDDEIRALKRMQRKIFEMRTGKIISAAWAEVCGQPVSSDIENMTADERSFFKKLVEVIREFKKRVLEGVREEKREFVLVRVKKDVEIQGADGKTYKLRREDVVTLPPLNAEALIKGGAAEKIEVKDHEVS